MMKKGDLVSLLFLFVVIYCYGVVVLEDKPPSVV